MYIYMYLYICLCVYLCIEGLYGIPIKPATRLYMRGIVNYGIEVLCGIFTKGLLGCTYGDLDPWLIWGLTAIWVALGAVSLLEAIRGH